MSVIKDPLFNEHWVKFNEEKWWLKSELIELSPKNSNKWYLKSIIYKNKRGKIVNPPYNPYFPVYFECAAQKKPKLNQRKREAYSALADLYYKKGLFSGVNLSPVVDDLRPFIWKNMLVTPRYTYHIDLLNYEHNVRSSVINKAKKAKEKGYYCEVTSDFNAVIDCLKSVEKRKKFSHRIDVSDMKSLHDSIGNENFVAFIAINKDGVVKGTRVSIYEPGGRVIAWAAGIKKDALKDGVNNLLGEYSFNYFKEKECKVFDFVGANMHSVASMKEDWGGDLITYYNIRQRNFRNFVKEFYNHTLGQVLIADKI